MIDAGLFSLLSTTSAITTLCETRIYPVILPTGPLYPCLLYKQISIKSNQTLDTSGYQRWRVEFDCFGETYLSAAGLRAAVRKLLEGYRGTLTDGTRLQDGQFVQLADFFEDDARVYRCMIEMHLFFNFN